MEKQKYFYWATSQSARFDLVMSTSAAYSHGQIVDAELINQSERALCFSYEVFSCKKRSKYVKMFEREKPITNLSLTLLSVANKFDIIAVWKSHEYIYLIKLNVINMSCTEPDQTLVRRGI